MLHSESHTYRERGSIRAMAPTDAENVAHTGFHMVLHRAFVGIVEPLAYIKVAQSENGCLEPSMGTALLFLPADAERDFEIHQGVGFRRFGYGDFIAEEVFAVGGRGFHFDEGSVAGAGDSDFFRIIDEFHGVYGFGGLSEAEHRKEEKDSQIYSIHGGLFF